MKKGTVLNLSRFSVVITYIKSNWCYLTLLTAILSGIVLGTLSVGFGGKPASFAADYTESFLSLRTTGNFAEIFISSLSVNLTFLILIFIFATSLTGVSFIPVIMGCRGYLFGVVAGSVYSKYSFEGIAFNALILIPPTALFLIFLLVISKHSMKMSLCIIKITLPDSGPRNLSVGFKQFGKKALLTVLPIIITALLDSWLSTKFISIFKL